MVSNALRGLPAIGVGRLRLVRNLFCLKAIIQASGHQVLGFFDRGGRFGDGLPLSNVTSREDGSQGLMLFSLVA